MAKETVQQTLSYKLGNETIISKPFDFEAFCLVDDMRYSSSKALGPTHMGMLAVSYMFEGTRVTEKVLEAMPFTERAELCRQVSNMYLETLANRGDSDGDSKNA